MIGQRIKAWRRRRGGPSQGGPADLAGLSQSYLSQLEAGQRPLDRESTQVAVASALNISVAQLLGTPAAGDPVRERATLQVPDIRTALVELSAGERRAPVRNRDTLRAAVQRTSERRNAADYAGIAPTLSSLLLDVAGHGADMAPELIEVLFAAQFALRSMGVPDLARDAAEVGVRTAEKIEEPHWRGAAYFSWVQAFPPESASLGARLTAREAAALQPETGREALETYGRLHLLAALQTAIGTDAGAAHRHLQEAESVARHLGEPVRYGNLSAGVTGSWFGPTQVDLWRVSIAAELGDAATALRVAERIDLHRMPVPNRHVYYHLDMARALTACGKDLEAMHSLAEAERVAPQHFRFSPLSRDLVGALAHRAKGRAAQGEMARLAHTLGIDPA